MKRYILIISLILFQQTLFSQSYVTPEDREAIDQQLDSHFGIDYKIYDIIFVDSLEVNFDRNRKIITDWDGTLDDCIVFTAEIRKSTIRNVKGVVGVYRGGQIIWYSDYIVPDDEIYGSGKINVIFDFNNDGLVEIMTEWLSYGGMRYKSKSLFVHTWDGNQGTLSIELNEDGSPISCYAGKDFDYIDVQGDGIFEIINSRGIEEDYPEVFEWNGINYVKSAIELETTEMCFPRNNFTPIVTAVVKKEGKTLRYSYKVENSVSSAQSINKFDVYGYVEMEDSVVTTLAKNWHGHMLAGEITWRGRKINPGESISGLYYITSGLPIIGKTFLRGFNYKGSVCYADDYKNNSVKKKTIAAKLPPVPFIATDFINSIISHTINSYSLSWIQTQDTRDKYNTHFNNAKNYLQQNNNSAAKSELQLVLNECNADSSTVLTSEAYALLYFNTEYLIEQIPDTEPGLPVKLQNSQGNLLQGGSLQYYDGSWMDAVNHGDGTFNVITERIIVNIRMTYEGGNQQFNNVPVGPDTVTFQTVNSTVKLLNSLNEPLADPSADGTVQFYAGSWREFGAIVNGTASKELLPRQYSFRMIYGGANNDKQQNIGTDPVVVFQTVNSTVQLLDSQGNLIEEEGIVQYYAGSWRTFGTTTSGTVSKELLPKIYSFRMTHEGVNNDKQQDIGVDDTVSFSTVFCVVQVKDSQNQPVDGAEVKYYSGSWRDIGLTANGEVSKELLPKNLTFRVIHNGVVQNKQQDIGTNSTVEFVVE